MDSQQKRLMWTLIAIGLFFANLIVLTIFVFRSMDRSGAAEPGVTVPATVPATAGATAPATVPASGPATASQPE
jgi:hypothetical protein